MSAEARLAPSCVSVSYSVVQTHLGRLLLVSVIIFVSLVGIMLAAYKPGFFGCISGSILFLQIIKELCQLIYGFLNPLSLVRS